MKNVILFLMMGMTSIMFSQNNRQRWSQKDPAHYFYTNLSFDANMAFGIKDNTDTVKADRGFDWDAEIGVRSKHIGIYIFYGQFNEFNYQNYGSGFDYYFNWFRERNVDLSIGVAYSQIIREDFDGNHGSFGWYHARGVATWWIFDDVGLTGRLQYQQRGDLKSKKGVIEGSIGITYKFNR
jgi:hypothetical protein